jgi:hypothetical protein
MQPQQEEANKYDKAVQAAIAKAAKDFAPKRSDAPEQQPQKDRGGPER